MCWGVWGFRVCNQAFVVGVLGFVGFMLETGDHGFTVMRFPSPNNIGTGTEKRLRLHVLRPPESLPRHEASGVFAQSSGARDYLKTYTVIRRSELTAMPENLLCKSQPCPRLGVSSSTRCLQHVDVAGLLRGRAGHRTETSCLLRSEHPFSLLFRLF